MFFVTFHQKIDNVYAYDDDGNQLSTSVLDKPGDELRGIYLEGSYLYVVDGGKKESKVYCYTGSATSYKRAGTFVSPKDANSIDHPFAVAFDGQGNCYISNQNTNVVAAFEVADGGLKATPAGVGSYLKSVNSTGQFLDATLIASSESPLPNAPQTKDVPAVSASLGGLGVDIKKGKVQNSVRDVVFYNLVVGYNPDGGPLQIPLLFVVDEPAGYVRLYDPVTGKPLKSSNQLKSPVHLLISGDTIYVGAGSQVYSSPVPNPTDPNAPAWDFEPVNLQPPVPSDQSVSGMAFDADGNFHVAVRTNSTVWKYDSSFASGVEWACGEMPDQPEFLLYVAD